MKKPCLSKAFGIRRPSFLGAFPFALLSAAFLSLFASPAHAQNVGNEPETFAELYHYLDDLRAAIVYEFEDCPVEGEGTDHFMYDLIIRHEAEARRWVFMAHSFPGIRSFFERSISEARQAFELVQRYPCPYPHPGGPGGGGPGGGGPGGGGPGGDGPGSDGSGGSDGSDGGGSEGGDVEGSTESIGSPGGGLGGGVGCTTAGGPFGLGALVALAFMRRKSSSRTPS